MTLAKTLLRFADKMVAYATRYGVIAAMSVLFLLLMARVIARTTEIPFTAYDEIVELATVWLIILGTLALWREAALYRVSIVLDAMPGLARFAEVFVQVIMLAFALTLIWFGGKFTMMIREVTAFMQIDMTYYYGAVPFSGVVMACYSLIGIWRAVCNVWTRAGQGDRADSPTAKKPHLVDHL